MSKIFVTIYESSAEAALQRISSLPGGYDGVELRVDSFSKPGDPIDLAAFRNATSKELMFTRRARSKEQFPTLDELWAAHDAGFDIIDVEIGTYYEAVVLDWIPQAVNFITSSNKAMLSYHDYEGVSEYLEQHIEQLSAWEFKIAVTPRTFEENLRLLRIVANADPRIAITLFGMGDRGLYSRMLAPFFGSRLMFVAADAESIAAPGQLTLDQALAIYRGADYSTPPAIFVVTGNPAAHSRSPYIHNPLFRERGAAAVYAIAEVETFDEISAPFLAGDELAPIGLSITAPFKEQAFEKAMAAGARVSSSASRARAINTLVRFDDGSLQAGNTDVSGFVRLIGERGGELAGEALVIGAGGTARAALVALEQLGRPRAVTNRSSEKGEALAREFGARFIPLSGIGDERFPLVIDTLPAAADFELPQSLCSSATVITADYSGRRATTARTIIDGQALLEAQAVEQNAVFMHALSSWKRRTM